MAYIFCDVSHAIQAHDKIINVSGGKLGTFDVGKLESILIHIQNDEYYPTFESKLTHLVFSVNKSHCFVDGNKRTSIALGGFFLELNGLGTLVNKFIIEMENIAIGVADNLIDKDLLGEVIYSIITETEYSEEIKLKLITALN